MMDLLIKDLDKDMTEAHTEERDAQADYEVAMRDSAEKRAADSKTLAEKEGAKANLQTDLQSSKEVLTSTSRQLAGTLEYISSLHAECDWLLKFFEMRKTARAGEVDALNNAKAVLSGADFSLLQRTSLNLLRNK